MYRYCRYSQEGNTCPSVAYRPGIYELNGRLNTVRELVNESQGLTGDAFLNRAVLYRQREDLTSDVYKRQADKYETGKKSSYNPATEVSNRTQAIIAAVLVTIDDSNVAHPIDLEMCIRDSSKMFHKKEEHKPSRQRDEVLNHSPD